MIDIDLTLDGLSTIKGGWITDIHLDALHQSQVKEFFISIAERNLSFLLIGGDICNGEAYIDYLKELAITVDCPVYFVLGNHDFYFGSIQENRQLASQVKGCDYLTNSDLVELTPRTALIGHDGWADGRAGDFMNSSIVLNDYVMIKELRGLTREERMERLNILGKESAESLRPKLRHALKKYQQVIVLMHPPPFRESCLYDNKVSDDNWAPHFVCQAMGEMLLDECKKSTSEVLVLCGHCHHAADKKYLPNLRVISGDAEYGIIPDCVEIRLVE